MREETEKNRHELSLSLSEGTHYQNLNTTSRPVASQSSPEIEQWQFRNFQLSTFGQWSKDEVAELPSSLQKFFWRYLEPT